MSDASNVGLRLGFDNLPLMEAVVRASFSSPISLTYKQVIGVAERLRSEFPQVSEPAQIEIGPGVGTGQIEFGPSHLPGVVYEGNRDGLRVSVHAHVVVTRWMQPFVVDQPKYPHYQVLRDAHWRAVEALRSASQDELPPIVVVNMSYVNFLKIGDSASELRQYFSDLAQLGAAADAEQVRKIEGAWKEKSGIDLRFTIEQVTRTIAGESSVGYRLTTAGGRRLSESVDSRSALDDVHDRLQHFFRDLISNRAKKEWGLRESGNA